MKRSPQGWMFDTPAGRSPLLEQLDMSAPPIDHDRAKLAVIKMKERIERNLKAFRKIRKRKR